jgi:hypothetical protein
VKTIRPFLLASMLVLSAFFLTGCGGNWLVGKWTLDRDRTVEAMTPDAEVDPGSEKDKGILKDIFGGLQKGLSRVLLSQLEGTVIEFTSTEVRRTREGIGSAQAYEIIEKPDADTYLVKYDDGEINTWNRIEDGIRMKLGEGDLWVYFRPVE